MFHSIKHISNLWASKIFFSALLLHSMMTGWERCKLKFRLRFSEWTTCSSFFFFWWLAFIGNQMLLWNGTSGLLPLALSTCMYMPPHRLISGWEYPNPFILKATNYYWLHTNFFPTKGIRTVRTSFILAFWPWSVLMASTPGDNIIVTSVS